MKIELDKCVIQSWRENDAQLIASHANNRKVWINLRNTLPHPYKVRDAEIFIRSSSSIVPEVNFAIEVDGEAAGGIGIMLDNDDERVSPEVGFWLGEKFWGRGISTEALIAFTEYAMREFSLTRMYAYVFEWNKPCLKVLEKSGYRLEARLKNSAVKDEKVIDQFLYSFISA